MINLNRLKDEQIKLSKNIILKDSFKKIERIAGIDQAYIKDDVISCIVICDAKTLKVIETKIARVPAPLPYKAGFLAYREMPAMIEAFSNIDTFPDIIIVDGNGISHIRRLGLASHFGLVINRPTIGITTTKPSVQIEKGKIYFEKELRGFELKTKEHSNPIYVSPGHMVSFGTALKIVTETIKLPHKLPEPLHLAHKYARKEMQRVIQEKIN